MGEMNDHYDLFVPSTETLKGNSTEMAANKATVFMTGKLYWAKIIGEPRPNFAKDGREWAFEFEPDEEGAKALKQHKLADRLKDKYEDRGKFLTLRKPEFNKDGNPNPPIRVYDADDNEWPKDKLIGNGTTAHLKVDIRDYGVGKKKGIYPAAIRVVDLVEYQSSEFGAMDAGDFKAAKPPKDEEFKKDFGLDDDLPF